VGKFFAELKRRRVPLAISIYVVSAWLLMQIADVLFPGWGIREENIRFLFYAAVACFPIAFIIGWKYDITLHGIERTPSLEDEAKGDADLSLGRVDHAILAILSLAVVGILVGFGSRINDERSAEAVVVLPNSVAVLPLANISEDPENEYFSTGLWQELINVLGHIQGFRVTPTTSADYFRDREHNLEDIKHKLLVASILTGSVQRTANRVRISLALTDTSNGTNLWSESYDRDLKDIFAIQSEIAHAVAEVMKVRILGQEDQRLQNAPTINVEAYDMVMLAREADTFERANQLIDRALELDPNYAEAHLARLLNHQSAYGSPDGPTVEELLGICKSSLETVEKLITDPRETSADYNWLKAICLRRTLWMGRGDIDMEREMEAAFKKSVEINPTNSVAYISYSIYLRRENRVREAEDQIRKSLELDRLYPSAMFHLARVLSIQGNDDEAIEWNTRVIEYFDYGYGSLALRYSDLGRYDSAVAALLKAPDLNAPVYGSPGDIRYYLAQNHIALRDPEGAKTYEKTDKVDTDGEQDDLGTALDRSWELAREGRYDDAYEVAAAAIEKAGITTWYVLNEPAEFAVLAGRFEDAIRLYDLALPSLTDPIRPDISNNHVSEAIGLAYSLQQTGETARAAVLFGRILDTLEGRRRVGLENIGVDDACIYASIGETDKALAAIREAIDAGWRGLYDNGLMKMPYCLESLAGNPAFDGMVAEIDADLAAQLERVRKMDK
jgi:TolB-like protein